ncbi:MAG: undecaprenyl-diphosphatase [Oleispira sp.]|jgi:undecaprenyl-diphosphatase
MDRIESINLELFLKINAGTDSPAWLINIATAIAEGLIYLIPVFMALCWLRGSSAQRSIALKLCVVTLLALGLNQLIALVWQYPRPFEMGVGHSWLSHVPDSSFPSDHVTIFAVMSIVLLFDGMRKSGIILLLASTLVAWARIYLGVHYPLDMIGALIVSIFSYLLSTPLWNVLGAKATVFFEHLYRVIFGWPISKGWIRR